MKMNHLRLFSKENNFDKTSSNNTKSIFFQNSFLILFEIVQFIINLKYSHHIGHHNFKTKSRAPVTLNQISILLCLFLVWEDCEAIIEIVWVDFLQYHKAIVFQLPITFSKIYLTNLPIFKWWCNFTHKSLNKAKNSFSKD